MKKFAVMVCVIACVIGIAGCARGGVILSAFPDPVFREYLKGYDSGWIEYDSNGNVIRDASGNIIYFGKDNGILEDKEIEGITGIHLDNRGIKSLQGIEHLTALTELLCYGNQLTELDVSSNTALTSLSCGSNQLTELNLSNNTALTWLECDSNQLTELDLSNNTALMDLLCWYQKRSGLKVKRTSEGYYEVNIKDYVSHPENIDADSISPQPISYSKETGILTFSEPVTALRYNYITHSPNNMNVTITSPLSIAALERSQSGTVTNTIIRNITDDSYIGLNSHPLTESTLCYYYKASDYGKSGLAADGNSRLILRVQTDKPGTVSFSFNEDIGAKLESLSRKELTASDQLSTTEINSNIHQVSAVLVAPERFPEDKNFPSDTFKIHVKFTDEGGEITEDDLELKIEAAPVILIHGLNAHGMDTFGIGENSGIWHSLTSAGFRDIRCWDYDGRKGPEEILSGTGSENGLYTALTEVFRKYANRGIVCTRADFVCHSMGGLMARKYLDESGKDIIDGNNWSTFSYKQGMVRRVITVATPHRGSPFAELALERPGLARMFFGKDCTSAFTDLMMSAPRSYGFPADVPMYSIYGDISEGLTAQLALMGASEAGKFTVKKLPMFPALTLPAVAFGVAAGTSIAVFVNEGMFHGEGHDIVVAVSSAIGDFAGHECGYKGWDYMHTNICHQDITGSKVVSLLKGDSSAFKTFGASAKTAVSNNIPSAKKSEAEDLKLIEALNLKIEPSVFTVSDSTSQTVTFSVKASASTTYDIYCAVEAGNAYRLFKLPDSNDGKTFSAELVFTGQDAGVMNAFCFSQNPNDNEGKSLLISNAVNILALSDITSANIISLDFAGASTIYTSVNSETPAGLYAVDSDGRYYDISSPLNGTQWTSTEIARVNDNGCILGLSEGTTTLTATFNGLTASINVEVSAALIEDEEENTPPEILTDNLTNAITNQPYNLQLTASGTTPLTWTHKGNLPKGLTLNTSGVISGTPTKAGKYTFTVTASNTYGESSQRFTLQVYDPVSITTASLKAGNIGKNYSVTMKAKGSKPLTWSAEGLPNGLSINEKGKISGKPTAHGDFTVKITAANPAGSVTKSLRLEIKGIAPKISGTFTKATLNESYSSALKVTGNTPLTLSISGTLPEGLTFDTSTGIISGIPTSYAKSGYKLVIPASNDEGIKSRKVTLMVKGTAPKITTAKLPEATVNQSYSFTLSAKGSGPITFTADDLPEGLTLSGGVISGKPTEAAKSFRIVIYAENPVKTVRKSFTLKINDDEDDTRLPVAVSSNENTNAALTDEVFAGAIAGGYIFPLGEISCDVSGMYDFELEFPDYVPEDSELVYIANSESPSDDDDIAEFFDENGNEISAVPASRKITVSIWLNEGVIYKPVVVVKK